MLGELEIDYKGALVISIIWENMKSLQKRLRAGCNLAKNTDYQTSTKRRNREPGSQAHPDKTGAIRHILTKIMLFFVKLGLEYLSSYLQDTNQVTNVPATR